MAVYKRGYSRYQGPRVEAGWRRLMVLPRYAWKRLFEQRLVLIAFIVAMIWPLLCGVFIYLSNHADLLPGGALNRQFLRIDGNFFLIFANAQCTFAVILGALAGPGLIAPDLTNNALPLYFSRPLTRTGYVAARMLTLVGLLALITLLPALALFAMQAGMAGWNWAQENWRFAAAFVAGFLIWDSLVSLVALASSAWVKWRIVAGGLVLGFFFVTAGGSAMINAVFRDTWGTWFNPSRQMYGLWADMLGADTPVGYETWAAVATLAIVAAALGAILEKKLRPVEVVA
ncbi:MAG: hypothetical protein R2729_15010 [Bryobacteraceae bacterium]